MSLLITGFKAVRKLKSILTAPMYTTAGKLNFYLNGARYGSGMKIKGWLQLHITRRGKMLIGNNLKLNSGHNFNVIGRQQKCILWVEGTLEIGDNVGMSATAIICKQKVVIGNSVVIGGNTVIYDSDFHSLDKDVRNNKEIDAANAKTAPVEIGDNVFIGAHSTILKGVKIGNNSIIGACSVITRNIPENEIWAGNPAVFVKKL